MKHYNNIPGLLAMFAFVPGQLIGVQNISQADIPLTITAPGKYILQENITYKKSGSAITIKDVNNVQLNLGSFSITLSNNEANGIFIKNSSEFVIENDAIQNTSSKTQKGSAIHIVNSNKGLIQNIYTINNKHGLLIKESSDIQIQNSSFLNAEDSGALVKESTAISFDSCVFAGNTNNGLRLSGNCVDCSLTNSIFPSANLSNLYVKQVSGMYIDNCEFTNNGGSSSKLNLVQFGGAMPNQIFQDVIMKNCTIVNRPAAGGNTAPEGLGIYQGSGFLVDSCVIDIDNTNQDPAADLSGIHISNPGLGVNGTIASNVIIRNCIIQGPATDGLYPDVGSSNVLIEDCLVTGAAKDGIFLAGTSASTVINNTVVNNGTNGIFLGEVSFSNAVINNVVNSNGFNPILSSIPPLGNGIGIASDSSQNLIQGNAVFNNGNNGIDDEGTNNQIFNNTAYANVNNNYFAATDTIIISTPGSSTLTGENITA